MNSFKDEIFNHYIDIDGLMTSDRDPVGRWTGGNQILTTACVYTTLSLMNDVHFQEIETFTKAINSCWVIKSGFTYEGLLNRNPNRPDEEGWDDYHVATVSYLLGTEHAEKICTYGEQNKWCFNNENPGNFIVNNWMFKNPTKDSFQLKNWFGRYPGFPGYIRLCADDSPGPLQAILLPSALIANAYSKSPDAKIKGWLRYIVAKKSNQQNCKEAVLIWEKKFKEQFGNLGAMFSAYGYMPTHPLSKIDSCLSF